MLPLDQLKDIVLQNFENTGYLDNLRAELKSNVIQIVDRQNDNLKRGSGFQWQHPNVEKIHSLREGMIGIQLLGEFLEHFKLDYTLSVYKKEVRTKDFNRDDLVENLNMKSIPNHNTPILCHLIQDYIKIMDMGYSANSANAAGSAYNNNNSNNNNYRNNNRNNNFYRENSGDSNGYDNASSKQTFADGFYKPKRDLDRNDDDSTSRDRYNDNGNKYNEEKQQQETEAEKKKREEEELKERQRKLEEYQAEQERLEKEREEEEARKAEQERRERIEREFKERQEKEKQEEEERERKKKEKEEERKKELEKIKKKTEKKLPKTAVNKVFGMKEQDKDINNLASIYGSAITGQPQQQMYEDDYADPNDPYAYDVNGVQDGAYGGYEPANNYDYDIDAPIGNKFNSNAYGKGGDPYADIDMDADINQNDNGKDIEDEDYYMEEEIDYFGQSGNSQFQYNKDRDKKNPMFTSSEDFYGASQSQGFDQSVDSEAIEQYDHYERIRK